MIAPATPRLRLRVQKNDDARECELGTWRVDIVHEDKEGVFAEIVDGCDEDVARYFLALAAAEELVDSAAAVFPELDNGLTLAGTGFLSGDSLKLIKSHVARLRANVIKIARIQGLKDYELLEV